MNEASAWCQEDLDTPAVVVDLDRLEANLAAMAADLAAAGVALRPHAKTHKCTEIGRRQLAVGACGLTVATLGEAEAFAAAGCDDLFIAYPLWSGGARAPRLRALREKAKVRVGIDSAEAAQALGAAVRGTEPLEVLIEIDPGQHRSGVQPTEAGPVADAAARCGLCVTGIFTHGGHAYAAQDAPNGAALDEVRVLEEAVESLRRAGHDVAVVSAGSTPTARLSAHGLVTESRPGTYVFGDRQQLAFGASPETLSLVVLSTVVSRARAGHIVIDAGSKSLSSDRPSWLEGHGQVLGEPDAVLVAATEEHGVVRWPDGSPRPDIGTTVAVVPNHVCPVVNLADELVVVASGRRVGTWPVDARRRR